MNIPKLRQQNGVTLLEVLVAMIIMSVSLMMLLNMAMIALDGNDWSNKTTVATQLLQEKLEQIRASGDFTNGSDTLQGVTRTWEGQCRQSPAKSRCERHLDGHSLAGQRQRPDGLRANGFTLRG
jgi:prepilin-type N-terminal cleavage/methylation domain-containing protein